MLVTNEITQMAKAIVTQFPILNGISSIDEHQQALILLEDLLEHYDENLIIIEALSNVITRYEDGAAEFDDFNKRQTAINLTTATLTVLIDQSLNNTNQV
uniref:Transcriptional regulator n=1 Tax=Marinomonas sp. (strain MWYL1) TaxID=400668 RepID=A6W328_MARMS